MSKAELAEPVVIRTPLVPRPAGSPLTRARQFVARRLYGAANALEEIGWRVDSQEWSGAAAGETAPTAPTGQEVTTRHFPARGVVGAAVIGAAAVLAAVGWRVLPHRDGHPSTQD
jgi:hypothetical protein